MRTKFFVKIAAVALVIAGVSWLYGWDNLFATLQSFANENKNPFVFLSVMGITCAIGFPLSLCYLFAGAAFGTFQGWLLSVLGLLASGSLGWLIGKFVAPKEKIEEWKMLFKIKKDVRMFNINFAVRAIPGIPYWTQNIFLGGINTDFKMYTITNICAQGAIALAMNYLGANITKDGWEKYAAFALLIAVMFCIHRILTKFYSKKISEK